MKGRHCTNIKDKFFCRKFINGYPGDAEYYPTYASIRSYNKQKLRQGLYDDYKSLKKGFVEYW